MCFVETGEALLGITAAHVHEACVAFLATSPDTSCQIGGHTFDPADRLIDIDDELDLATYKISAIQVSAAGSHVHTPTEWPPPPPGECHTLIAGFPWSMTEERTHSSTRSFISFIGKLTAESPRNLVMGLFKSSSVPWGRASLPRSANLGGMSGGPLYALRTEPVHHLELTGITSMYDQAAEVAYATPLSLVRPDGTLLR